MRYFLSLSPLAIAALLALPALADPPEEGGKKGDRPRREEMRERMIKEFDSDGDGKLNDDERQQAREAMRERFGQRAREGRPDRGKKGDRGPRGPGDHPPRFERLFNRFDEDSSDSLSRDEFKKLAQFVREHRPGPPGGPPHRPRFDGRRADGPPPREGFRRRPPPDGPHRPDRPGRPPRDESNSDRDGRPSPEEKDSSEDSDSQGSS